MTASLKRLIKIFQSFSEKEKKIFIAASIVAAFSLILTAGFILKKVTKIVPAKGGEYSEGLVGQPTYINPLIATREIDKGLVRLFFSNIYDLAEKIESVKDGRSWTVRLKEETLWHDGQPLTSDDIIFTVEKIQEAENRSPLFASWQGVLAERVSEKEVNFNLGVPYAFFENNLKNLYIMPKHIFANVPVANWRISEFNLKPIGSGPYRFDSYSTEPNGFISLYHLKTNPNYFKAPPLITNFNINFFPDKESLLEAFNMGRIDGVADIQYDDIAKINRSYETFFINIPSYYAVFLNQSQNLAIKEKEVRRALALATERTNLIQAVFKGHATAIYGPIPPQTPYWNGDILTTFSSSSEDAAAILDNAGWKLNQNSTREKSVKNGSLTLEFTITVPDLLFLNETAKLIKNDWEKIGVKVNIKTLPLQEVTDHIIKNREYQMLLFGNILNSNFDLFSFWHSSERFYPGLNLALFNNKKADELIELIRRSFDAETRVKKFNELQEVITGDYPAIFLYSLSYLYVASKDLKGISTAFISEPADRFLDIPNWHLKTERVFR